MSLRLVIFDVDGTLVDSQGDIMSSMQAAFAGEGLNLPDRATVLSIVGLSLPMAMAELAPAQPEPVRTRMVETYKESYAALRKQNGAGSSPLYPGALEAIETLHAQPETLLGIATGKSKRGLDALLDSHGLGHMFVTQQVADFHPSKPHPAMIHAALSGLGIAPLNAVMVGDTRFDMEMAQAAGVPFVGVGWGYHAPATLTGAAQVIDDFAALPAAIDRILGETT